MGRCKWVKALFFIVPLAAVRHALLRRHLLRCPRCVADAASLEDARSVIVPGEKIGPRRDFWPDVSRRLDQEDAKKAGSATGKVWRWAAAAAGILIVAGLVFLARAPRPPKAEIFAEDLKLRIYDVRIYGQPAQAYIFKTQDADRTFVWVEKR